MLDRTATAVQDLAPNARRAKGDVRACVTLALLQSRMCFSLQLC